jgi:hypothetical protein
MDSPVYISPFNAVTRAQYVSSTKALLGLRTRSSAPVGAIVALYDQDAQECFGTARVRNSPDKPTPCIEHSWLDIDVYSPEYQKYNRFDLYVHEVKILAAPLKWDRIRTMVGGTESNGGMGNMWKRNHLGLRRPFQTGEEESVVRRYELFINALAV